MAKVRFRKIFGPLTVLFANTNGGVVLLGVREKKDQFYVEGIVNPSKVRKELFDGMNNRQKVSCSLLTDAMVSELVVEEKNSDDQWKFPGPPENNGRFI